MAEKCRICGYKFKIGDGSLCPECFTARTDELSFDGNDFKATNIFGRSRDEKKLGAFLADEMREELHEDITIKKSLDREDTEKTRAFTAEGANVKNETFKDAFQERRNRVRSEQGRVYTNNSAASGSSAPKNDQQVNKFLDSIDPALKSRIYGSRPNESTFRYSSHNSGSTSNQQMLYGINGGRTPGSVQRSSYNYGYSSNSNSNYSKGSGGKAIAVIVVSIIIFIVFINIIALIDENTDKDDAKSNKSIGSVDIEMPDLSIPDVKIPDISVPDFNFNDILGHNPSTDYGDNTIYILGYSKSQTVKDALTDPAKHNNVYPIEGTKGETADYQEVMFSFYVDVNDSTKELPEIEEMTLFSSISGETSCVSYGYDIFIDDSNLKNGKMTISVSFLVPENADNFSLHIYYLFNNEYANSYIDNFTYNSLDEMNEGSKK